MPPPTQSGSVNHYVGEAGQGYFAWQRVIAKGSRIVASRFAPYIRKTDIVLDFGCGSGAVLAALDCLERHGIEVNPVAAAEARRRGLVVYETCHSVPDGHFDVVISNHALEHIMNPGESLVQLFRILKPGGKLCLIVPIDDWRKQRTFRLNDMHHHLYAWTPQRLQRWMQCCSTCSGKPC